MIDRSEAGSRSAFFGLWDLLALLEEVSGWALSGHSIDRDALRLRLGVFRKHELPAADRTIRVLILIIAEVRSVIEDAGRLHAGRIPTWPPAPSLLQTESDRLIDVAENVTRLPGPEPGTTDAPEQARHAVRRVLGIVSGSMALSDAQMDLNVSWLSHALASIDPHDRRRLLNAADLVFWAAAVVLAFTEVHSSDLDGTEGENLDRSPRTLDD